MKKRQILSLVLCAALVFGLVPAAAADTSSELTVTLSPTYCQTEARSMLTQINELRTGDDAWYWNSDDSTKTVCSGLSELSYDYELEKIAMQRAAEIALSYSHTRPDGTLCFTAYSEAGYSYSAVGENIAAGYTSAASVFTGWAEENESYSGQGHRRNMLSSKYAAVGIACVYSNGTYYWVQEFSDKNRGTTATDAVDTQKSVDITVASSSVSYVELPESADAVSLTEGEALTLPTVPARLKLSNYWSSTYTASYPVVYVTASWSSSDSSVLSVSDGAANALAAGEATLTAEFSGETVDVSVTVSHDLGDAVVSKEATCTEDGEKSSYCSYCKTSITEALPALGHNYEETVTSATCTEAGYTLYKCSRCGDSYTTDETEALGHSLTLLDDSKSATCTEDGYYIQHCSRCDQDFKTVVPATGHNYLTSVVPATGCNSYGYTLHQCITCGDTYITDKTDVVEHSYVYYTTDPTCTEEGTTYRTCSRCGWNELYETTEALGHDWDEGTVIREATETSDGLKRCTCSRCGSETDVVIPALNHTHSYTETVTAPTCTKAGYTTHTCACGDSYTDSEVPATGHTEVVDAAVEPDCTTDGKTEGSHCSVCGAVLTEQGTISAFGHSYVNGICIRCGAGQVSFTDVSTSDWFYSSVAWAVGNDITNGGSGNKFYPLSSCTRAQIVTFLWRAAGCPEPESSYNPFVDVPESQYYYKAVLWAVERGITNGTGTNDNGEELFAPDRVCTRSEIVTFLYRAAGEPEQDGVEIPFTDVPEGAWYSKAVIWAAVYEITNGNEKNEFMPNKTCTRAEAVTFLQRYSEL